MATAGEKELKRKWPVEEGLTAGTQKQEGRQINLVATKESKVFKRNKKGVFV